MKVGDKLYCKKDIIFAGYYMENFYYGKSYIITQSHLNNSGNTEYIKVLDCYFYVNKDEEYKNNHKLSEHFLTIKEVRKLKLEKLYGLESWK